MNGKPTLTPLDVAIGANAKRIRKELGLTQEDIAEIMECEPPMVSMLERGRRAWTTKYIYAICQKYNVSPARFFGAVEMSAQDQVLFQAMRDLVELRKENSDEKLQPSVKQQKDRKK